MARRYSGDVVVSMSWNARSRTVTGVVYDGRMRYRGVVSVKQEPSSSSYDQIAGLLIKRAEKRARQQGRRFAFDRNQSGQVRLRRRFVSPCPA